MTTAKKVRKKATKKNISLVPKNISPAKYNPRFMNDKAKGGLRKSMDEFQDISGITWNSKTGNIVTGHHRWENLIEEHGGHDNLVFEHLKGDKYAIITKEGVDTTYILRAVEWDKTKEKAANVTANSALVEGIFTIDLKGVLEDISVDLDEDIFADLRLDDLLEEHSVGTLDAEDGGEWETDITEVENTASNLDGIITTIKIECAQEMRSELFVLISDFVEKAGYGGKVKVK